MRPKASVRIGRHLVSASPHASQGRRGLLSFILKDRFPEALKSAQSRVLPIVGASADGRLSNGLRSVAARTAGMCRTAASDDMIVVELWKGRTRPAAVINSYP